MASVLAPVDPTRCPVRRWLTAAGHWASDFACCAHVLAAAEPAAPAGTTG